MGVYFAQTLGLLAIYMRLPTVAIVDYHINNLHSVIRAFVTAGARAIIATDAAAIRDADRIVLPGIGHFGQAVENLTRLGMMEALTEEVMSRGKPVLGICLGMQLMMAMSEEAPGYYGLAWLGGEVARLYAADPVRYKVPHIGWNAIHSVKESRLLRGIPDGTAFYFTHSYTCLLHDTAAAAATTDYGGHFTSVIEQNNIFAVQFHPEKSRLPGISVLKNFLTL